MALFFLDAFEHVTDLAAWTPQPQPPTPQSRTLVIEGPTWRYVGPGGIIITRMCGGGHRISPLKVTEEQ